MIQRSGRSLTYFLLLAVLLHRSLPFLLRRNNVRVFRQSLPFDTRPLTIATTINRPHYSIKEISSTVDGNLNVTSSGHQKKPVAKEGFPASEGDDNLLNFAQALSLDEIPPAVQNATASAVDLFTKAPNPPVCRIVTRAGSKLPTDPSVLPKELYQPPYRLLDKLGLYYHAQARRITTNSIYLEAISKGGQVIQEAEEEEDTEDLLMQLESAERHGRLQNSDDTNVTTVLRHSLEDAGYELLSRRDIDLCESLNAGYLLRLSILPDVSQLDPSIAEDFYPEKFYDNGTLRDDADLDNLLFDGRVLVFWRGYSQEITRGRLLLPKIDYLQASLVQRSAAWLKSKIDAVEMELFRKAMRQSRRLRKAIRRRTKLVVGRLHLRELATKIRKSMAVVRDNVDGDVIPVIDGLFEDEDDEDGVNGTSFRGSADKRSGSIRLGRYGGSKIRFVGSPNPNDALEPFTICEYNYDDINNGASNEILNKQYKFKSLMNATVALCEHDMYEEVNHNTYTCEYDARIMGDTKVDNLPRMQLLERVGISNLVDLFTKAGRREVVRAIFSKSKLVEPTYEEVIVVWRPLVKQKRKMAPPRFVSEFADMFDIEGFEQPPEEEIKAPRSNLEIRLFERVPMSNLPAVLPKTKLVFRPADAFLFDLISVITLTLVLTSVKFDSTRLDILAIASVIFWLFRTVIRYSNKLARYDLLVKTFLTSKISQRNAGAFKYLTYEAASQRAVRSALVLLWLSKRLGGGKSIGLRRDDLERECVGEVNKLLETEKEVQLNSKRAFQDLEDLQLLTFTESGTAAMNATDLHNSVETVKRLWTDLIDDQSL